MKTNEKERSRVRDYQQGQSIKNSIKRYEITRKKYKWDHMEKKLSGRQNELWKILKESWKVYERIWKMKKDIMWARMIDKLLDKESKIVINCAK